jgi:hypothetical protein
MLVSAEEFRAFCAFFFLLQRRQVEAQQDSGRSVTATMLRLIFTAADVGISVGSCTPGSCDLKGDGRLGMEELRNMLLVLIRESGSLAWLHMKYQADARFRHMLSDYCKSPLKWTADAALHELVTYDSPPALAAAPNLFSDTTRLTWEGLSKIMEVKRLSGGECVVEALTRRWMDAATAQLSCPAPPPAHAHEVALQDEDDAAAGSVAEEDDLCDSAPSHAPALPAFQAAGGGCYVGPGFPLPLGLAPPGKVGGRAGPALRVDSDAAKRFVR